MISLIQSSSSAHLGPQVLQWDIVFPENLEKKTELEMEKSKKGKIYGDDDE